MGHRVMPGKDHGRMQGLVRHGIGVTIALAVAVAPTGPAAAAAASFAGAYDGHFATAGTGARGVASGTLTHVQKAVDGTVVIVLGDRSTVTFAVGGRARGRRLVLTGTADTGTTLTWRARAITGTAVQGKAKLRAPGGTVTRGLLVLVRRAAAPDTCETYFRDTVMGQVLVPICARCHVAGGLAETSTLRVTIDDPAATRSAVAAHIDLADPSASRVLHKPLGELGHGGGPQIVAGGDEHLILQQWVGMVADGTCEASGGTGGPGGGGTGADLYTFNCASCHGADARGLQDRPDIHCHKSIHDVVRSGRGGPTGMPAFPALDDADIAAIQAHLDALCPAGTATGEELFASNCASCHGATGGGGRNADGVRGPDVRCQDTHDFLEKVRNGDDEMPAFPALDAPAIDRIIAYVRTFCSFDN
jgi:ubiquinol-cytochrome c reductase cytochrome c subunit